MAIVDLIMPKLGESIMEATILKWHKQPGDAVKMDETVLEIATDKVDSEVPSTAAGTIEEILFTANDVVPVGTTIARVRPGVAEPASPPQPSTSTPAREERTVEAETVSSSISNNSYKAPAQQSGGGNKFYSPL